MEKGPKINRSIRIDPVVFEKVMAIVNSLDDRSFSYVCGMLIAEAIEAREKHFKMPVGNPVENLESEAMPMIHLQPGELRYGPASADPIDSAEEDENGVQ